MTRKSIIWIAVGALLVAGGVAIGVAVSHGFDHARQIGAVAVPWHGYRGYEGGGGGFGYGQRFFPGIFLFLVFAMLAAAALVVLLSKRRWACLGWVAGASDPGAGDHPGAGEQ